MKYRILFLLLLSTKTWALELAYGKKIIDLSHTEKNNSGSILLNENGTLKGDLITIKENITQLISLSIEQLDTHGELDYYGHTQSGKALRTITQSELSYLSLSALLNTSFPLKPFIGYTKVDFQRKIQDTDTSYPISIEYDWDEYRAGLRAFHSIGKNHFFGFEFAALTSASGQAHIDMSEAGFSKGRVQLGSGRGLEGSAYYHKKNRASDRLSNSDGLPTMGF